MTVPSAYAAIALQAVLHRKSQGSLWLTWTLVAMFVPLAAAGWWRFAHGQSADVLFILAAFVLASLLLLWGALFARSLQEQASPAALRLVPGMRHRLLTVAGVLVLSAALFAALVIGLPLGRPGLVFVATGLLLVEVPLLQGWRAFLLIALCIGVGSRQFALLIQALLTDVGVMVGLILVVVEGRNAVLRLVGRPGSLPRSGPEVTAGRNWQYDFWPRRVTDRGAGHGQAPERLLAGLLGPVCDWRAFASIVFTAMLVPLVFWLVPGTDAVKPMAVRGVTLFFLPAALLGLAQQTVARIYASAHELALFRLSPQAPCASRINRVLASWWLRRFVAHWAVLVIATTIVLLLTKAELGLAAQAMTITGYTAFCAGYVLRDYSRVRRGDVLTNFIGLVGIPLVCLHVVLAIVGELPDAMRHAVPAGWLAAGCLYTWHRWRRMLAAPPAFPPGRRD